VLDTWATRVTAAPSTRVREPIRGVLAGVALVGGSLMIGGALLPWLSVYAGLDTLRGIDGINGRVLVGVGVVAVVLALLYAWRPSARLRLALGLAGFSASGFAAWVVAQLVGSYQQLGGDPLVLPSLGAGAFVSLAGGLCLLSTLLMPQAAKEWGARRAPAECQRSSSADARTAMLTATVAFLLSAAMIHLAVVGPHLSESTLSAAFFICAGLAQIAAALLLTVRPYRGLLVALIIGNALVIALWAVSRTAGLPIGPTPGAPEGVSLPDVLATIAEAAVVTLAAVLVWRNRAPLAMRRWIVRGGAAVASFAAAGMAIIAIVGVQSGGG
jgi:hypothetical protein